MQFVLLKELQLLFKMAAKKNLLVFLYRVTFLQAIYYTGRFNKRGGGGCMVLQHLEQLIHFWYLMCNTHQAGQQLECSQRLEYSQQLEYGEKLTGGQGCHCSLPPPSSPDMLCKCGVNDLHKYL
jgi:hypothetical protein